MHALAIKPWLRDSQVAAGETLFLAMAFEVYALFGEKMTCSGVFMQRQLISIPGVSMSCSR